MKNKMFLKSLTLYFVLLSLLSACSSFHAKNKVKYGSKLSTSHLREKNDGESSKLETGIYGYDLEVVRREQVQAPFRKLRLQLIGITGICSVACLSTTSLGLIGLQSAKTVADKFSLPNPILDAFVLASVWSIYIQDVKIKRQRLKEIDVIFQREKKGIFSPGNRAERRSQKSSKKMSKKNKLKDLIVLEEDLEKVGNDERSESKFGAFEKLKGSFDEVNRQSYAQALAMNEMLEEKGILKPLEKKSSDSEK
mmetsp:Transcript_12303/g.18432  ORF Transcript_12303/g.18432 Transcript_12303/m.18432 type:complete len:252 (+) Transcript_12303:37-792(+)